MLLVRIKAEGQPERASPDPVKFSRAALPDAPADGSLDEAKRARNPRNESSTDIAFADGRVLVAGISNGEFSSALRAIPCPFSTVDKGTVVENCHGAPGKFETRAPVRNLGPDRVGGESHLLAAYTCTPLVECAPNDLKPGATITGKTIAGLGKGNRPLGITVHLREGKDSLLMTNRSRGVIKVAAEQIAGAVAITAKVADTQGLRFD